jgi:hypothetical protein
LKSHPAHALPVLAAAAAGKGAHAELAASVLASTVAANEDVARAAMKSLDGAARSAIEAALDRGSATEGDEANESELPPVLRAPPWLTKAKGAPAIVVTGLVVKPFEEKIAWKKGERDRRAQLQWLASTQQAIDSTIAYIQRAHDATPPPSYARPMASVLMQLPEKELLEVLPTIDPTRFRWHPGVMSVLIARHGVAVIDHVLRFASSDLLPAALEALDRVNSPRVAPLMASALARLKKSRAIASEWLLAFREAAALGLVPNAVGASGAARDAAAAALRFMAQRGHRDAIEKVAKSYGDEALVAMRAVLDFDPLLTYPAKMPKLAAFVVPAALARPRLAKSGKPLPLASVQHIVSMLAISSLESPYAGLAIVREACDPRSLADMAWDLFQMWLVSGAPSKESWAFHALGHFGDDESARKLTPLVRAWPGEAAHARAVAGLEVLAKIGTDVALMHLHGIAQRLKFKGLQDKAREKIDQIADARGLSAEELADRLVPDLGLDEGGSLSLDFGARAFKVTFDEALKPCVLDDAGKRLVDLPKPNKSDDAAKAKDATAIWRALKKDAKTIATGQVLRLELAMCARRRWTRDVFQRFIVDHPLMVHLARRLVWGQYGADGADGARGSLFRVVEDRTLANANDDRFELADDARVGVVHRLEMNDGDTDAWSRVFGDYEIIQPFPQLARETFAPTKDEARATSLERVKGLKVPTGKVLHLDASGWRRGPPQDGGAVCWYEKPVDESWTICLDLSGIFTGMMSGSPEQELGDVYVQKDGTWGKASRLEIGALDPVVFSELARDLESLRA